MGRLGSALTLSTIAYAFKGLSKTLPERFDVRGLPILLEALKEPEAQLAFQASDRPGWKGKEREVPVDLEQGKRIRRGVVTICNHNSVVDDPLMWAMLPFSHYLPLAGPSKVGRFNRWTLGASDIMFTKPLHSAFFNAGQVIETVRGGGIFQPAVDKATKLLQSGEWIHIFPEGRVNQESINPEGGLLPFKWGVGRIIMDSVVMPEIIPIWLSGFDTIMPEPRGWPKPLPRFGGNVSITVGSPLTARIQPLVDSWRSIASTQGGTVGVGGEWEKEGKSPGGEEQRRVRSAGDLADGQERQVRIDIVNALQEGLRELGQQVETEEGRFDRDQWSQSTSWSSR